MITEYIINNYNMVHLELITDLDKQTHTSSLPVGLLCNLPI